jgi:Periplasmic copper-binding protein (NosD)
MHRVLSTVAAAFVALLVMGPGPAFAAHVSCGDVITSDTTLDADVICGAEDPGVTAPDGQSYALLIGADGVQLDLAGHSVVVPPVFQTGNLISALGNYGHDHVTVANGELTESVTLQGARRNRLSDLSIGGFIGNLVLDASRANEIRRVRMSGDQGSALIRNGSNDNTLTRNDFDLDNGVQLLDSDRNAVLRNTSCASTAPYSVWAGSDGNLLKGNVAACPAGQALYGFRVVDGAKWNILANNTANAIGSIAGIYAGDASTVLLNNTADDNAGLGMLAVPGVYGRGNHASGNGDPRQCVEVTCR